MILKNISATILLFIVFNQTISSQIGFEPYQTILTGSEVSAMIIKDINNDNLPDMVLANKWVPGSINYNSILVYYQNINGSLSNPSVFSYSDYYYYSTESIDAADLNNDNKVDIVVELYDSIFVFYQVSETSFHKEAFYSAENIETIKTGDLNNDGLQDVAVTHHTLLFLNVFYQDTTGNLNPVSYPSPQDYRQKLEILDINHDSLNDLIYFYSVGSNEYFNVYLQNSNHELNFPMEINPNLNFTPYAFAIGLLNDDEKYDIAFCGGGNYPADLALVFQKEDAFDFYSPVLLTAYDCPHVMNICDLNCDGNNEVILGHTGWHAISFFEKGQDGNYGDYVLIPNIYGNVIPTCDLQAGDLNSDNMPEIVFMGGGVTLHYNDSKPPASDTLVYVHTVNNDTVYQTNMLINNYFDTIPPYVFYITDTLEINAIINFIEQRESYYEIHKGLICGNYINDSSLIDSNLVSFEHLLSADTVLVFHSIDTVNLGISDFFNDRNISIFPNPVEEYLYIVLKDTDPVIDITISDASNRQIMRMRCKRNTSNKIDFRNKSKGVYFISFSGKTLKKTLKIVCN